MKRKTGTTVIPDWATLERAVDAKSIDFDGTYWTVRRFNRSNPSVDPICSSPTEETKALLSFLQNFDAGQLVGAQTKFTDSSLGPGQLLAVSGDTPVIYGYEIADLRPSSGAQTLDGVNAAAIKADIESKFSSGKIISIVDHLPNFLTGGDWYDKTNRCMREIAPGGSKHTEFKAYLDRVIAFLDSLSSGGKKVPVLFRIFHEAKLATFWWSNYLNDGSGVPYVSDDEYLASARFAVGYMKTRLTNVIFMYCQGAANGANSNPDGTTFTPKNDAWYWATFPGVEYCDLVTCDIYSNGAPPFPGTLDNWPMRDAYSAASRLAESVSRPFALAECGFAYSAQSWSTTAGSTPDEQAASTNEFWTELFLPQLQAKSIQPKFFLFWHGTTTMAFGNTQTANASTMLLSKLVQMSSRLSRIEIYGF